MKKRVKSKLPVIALAALLVILLSACGETANTPPPAQVGSPDQQTETLPPPAAVQAPDAPSAVTQAPPDAQPPDSPPEELPQIELVVFAAASMTETLTAISDLYSNAAPNVTLVFNFDSSGTLKTQIEEGADCDMFISAAPRQMNELEEIDMILSDTRINLLENKVALVVPAGNPKNITGFDSLLEALEGGDILMAMGNSDVPVGQYTQRILEYFDLDEEALARSGLISYGSNVKEVTTQVSEASVDCGVVYATDAFSAELEVAGYATAEMCGQVIYPIAVLNGSGNVEAAKAFLTYLTSPEAMAVFESVGFSAA